MIKGHHWLPDSIYDFFKWNLQTLWPMSDYGVESVLLEQNVFQKKVYSAWWTKMDNIYPHTLKYRFIKSICQDDINELKLCLDKCPDLIAQDLQNKYNCLTLASSLNKTALIEYLILRGGDIDKLDLQGRTPLIEAVNNWQIESIKLLVEKGADIQKKGLYGFDAQQVASKKGYEQISKFLEARAKEQIKPLFPKVNITFDFEKLLRNPIIEELIANKKLFTFDPMNYPFNDFGGSYKVNLVKTENLSDKI